MVLIRASEVTSMTRYVDFLSTDMSAHAGCHGQDGAQTSRSSPSSQGAVWKHRSLGTAQRRQEKHRRAQEKQQSEYAGEPGSEQKCSTSLPGGNLVDGLPPALNNTDTGEDEPRKGPPTIGSKMVVNGT